MSNPRLRVIKQADDLANAANALGEAMKKKRKGGAPRKTHDGLNCALYVRVNPALRRRLETLRLVRSAKRKPGTKPLSGADVVRALIDEEYER